MRAETRGKRAGCVWVREEARRSWPREKRRVLVRRKVRRETVMGFLGGLDEWEGEGEVGARRSLRVPVRRRAKVERRAMMETWVAGELEGGMAAEGG